LQIAEHPDFSWPGQAPARRGQGLGCGQLATG